MSDAPRFVKWLNDPAVNIYLPKKKVTLNEEQKRIKRLRKVKNEIHFSIDTREGVLIGDTSLEEININDKNAMLMIMIGDKTYWNGGYGTDALRALLYFASKKLKLHRISLWVYGFNIRAIKVYKKLGFKIEGRRREDVRRGTQYYDSFTMGILAHEWKRRKQA